MAVLDRFYRVPYPKPIDDHNHQIFQRICARIRDFSYFAIAKGTLSQFVIVLVTAVDLL